MVRNHPGSPSHFPKPAQEELRDATLSSMDYAAAMDAGGIEQHGVAYP